MVDCMNASGITHVCLGNHETDVPMNDLATRIKVDSCFKWVNTNLRELDSKINVTTLPHDVIEVTNPSGAITKTVGLLGLLTDDPSVYRPGVFAGAKIEPVIETTKRYMQDVIDPMNLDLIIPLTHQRINEDKQFCETFGSSTFPIIVGGHDHEPHDETYAGSRVVKTGMDGENTAIIDFVWKKEDDTSVNDTNFKIKVKIIPTKSYPADEDMLKRVESHERILHELNAAKIFRFRDWLSGPDELFSTKNNRLGYSNGTTKLAMMMRMGMRAEIGLINAGNVRGGCTYPADQEWFTMSDLKAQVPFCVGICAVKLPGQVIEDTINESRSKARLDPPIASGGYVHTCDKVEFSVSEQRIVSVNGHPFDPNRMYLTCLPTNWFEGMDDHTPLMEWAKGTPYAHAKESSSKPLKVIVVELFSAAIWLEMGSFHDIDLNGDGVLTHNEVKARALQLFGEDVADVVVDNVFSVADGDQDGIITPLDMMVVRFVARDMINHVTTGEELEAFQKIASEVLDKRPSHEDVSRTMQALKDVLDIDKDGKITREEVMSSIGEVRRRSLLLGQPSASQNGEAIVGGLTDSKVRHQLLTYDVGNRKIHIDSISTPTTSISSVAFSEQCHEREVPLESQTVNSDPCAPPFKRQRRELLSGEANPSASTMEQYYLFGTCGGRQFAIYEYQIGKSEIPWPSMTQKSIQLYQDFESSDITEDFRCITFASSCGRHNDSGESRRVRQYLCVAGKTGDIFVVDVEGCKVHAILDGTKENGIFDLQASPMTCEQYQNSLLAAASLEEIRVWNLATFSNIVIFGFRRIGGHVGNIYSIGWNSHGTHIVSGGKDASIKVWSLDVDRIQQALEVTSSNDLSSVFRGSTVQRKEIVLCSHDKDDSFVHSPSQFLPFLERFPIFTSPFVHDSPTHGNTCMIECVMFMGDLILSKSTGNEIILWKPLLDRRVKPPEGVNHSKPDNNPGLDLVKMQTGFVRLTSFQYGSNELNDSICHNKFAMDKSKIDDGEIILSAADYSGNLFFWKILANDALDVSVHHSTIPINQRLTVDDDGPQQNEKHERLPMPRRWRFSFSPDGNLLVGVDGSSRISAWSLYS